MKYKNILEEEIKNKVTRDFFQKFDCTKILGKIDFAIKIKRPANTIDLEDEYLLWAEAKQKPTDILVMLTQLVLTVGKARTFDEILPPPFLGCYDNEKIAFVPYTAQTTEYLLPKRKTAAEIRIIIENTNSLL
jgi:uncharacterized protein (DUF3820 family)